MPLVPMKELLIKAYKEGYAVPSFCVWSAETIQKVIEVAEKLKAPVILMNGPGEFPLVEPGISSAIAYNLIGQYDVQAALHLDHGNSIDMVKSCISAKYTSVMLDYSTRPFEENAKALRQVVEMAHPSGISVEGEIGSVGFLDKVTKEGGYFSSLTDPEQALQYAKQTGVDALAVSIGNAHGIYTKLPQFEFDLLAKINSKVRIPLVLHGGSGTPEQDIKKAISLGIAKVNVASELLKVVRESLLSQWNAGKNLWVPAAQVEAMNDLARVVEKWILIAGAAGRS